MLVYQFTYILFYGDINGFFFLPLLVVVVVVIMVCALHNLIYIYFYLVSLLVYLCIYFGMEYFLIEVVILILDNFIANNFCFCLFWSFLHWISFFFFFLRRRVECMEWRNIHLWKALCLYPPVNFKLFVIVEFENFLSFFIPPYTLNRHSLIATIFMSLWMIFLIFNSYFRISDLEWNLTLIDQMPF